MIRSLRKKFVLIAMICLICVTTVLIAAINVANYLRTDRRCEDLMDMITVQKPSEEPSAEEAIPPKLPKPDNDGKDRPWFSGKHEDFKSISITPETEFTTRWFSVTFSAGEVVSVSMDRIASVSSEKGEAYARTALRSGDRSGYQDVYKYRIVSENDTETVYFLNCENEFQHALSLLITTVLIGLAVLILLLILLTLFSRRAVKPVIENMERQRRFITDAGHELKTPLAIISADTDVLSLTGESNEWVESIRNQTKRMEQLVQDLLTLARSEETPVGEFASFSFSDAVLDTAMPFETLAAARGKRLKLEIAPDISLQGDEGALRRLISILMENALKHSDGDCEIFLSLRREGKRVVLEQKNPCTPLPSPSDLERLFDRFYRPDTSRSRDGGGYGIGLSIARSIVEAHKGKIRATAEGNCICFTVIF
ncbi:MAG: HAMP domain-containing histidine kinase [Clostridia bacterium]|nr:HAMP domain-containing histidine kinase [Clostridia bacterium]